MNKCIFLDRDGVLNVDRVDYVYKIEDMIILDGVVEALQEFKKAGYLLIIITNQSGIAKGIYTKDDVMKCHDFFQDKCGHLIDSIYFSPYHEKFTSASLTRKPDSLMIEKAIAKYKISPELSWMIGDNSRDMKAAQKAGIKSIFITGNYEYLTDDVCTTSLLEASKLILN